MTTPHDTPEVVEAMCRSLDQAAYLRPASHSIAAMLRRLHARAVAAEEDARTLQRTFNLLLEADIRGIKLWQEATGRTLTWPDRADMVVFLLEKLDAAEAALTTARADALREAADIASAEERRFPNFSLQHAGEIMTARRIAAAIRARGTEDKT